MEPIFHYKLVNDRFGDPCLYIRILRERRALLFDLGDITKLTPSETYKITDAFVTHTHIDHFIGFDILIRSCLRRERPLNIYGPPNISRCVAGKLGGYTWNLIKDYPLVLNVFAYNGRTIVHSRFAARNKFRRQLESVKDADGTLLHDHLFTVKAANLSHGTPCLAYSIKENFHINIDKDRLKKKGIGTGPWLADFKRKLREGVSSDTVLEISGRRYSMNRLMDIVKISEGQKISYATDVGMSKRNADPLVELVRGSDVFYCEAYFLEKDRDRAIERFHLTAKQCGLIAKEAEVEKLFVSHISPKYMDHPDSVISEAMKAFRE